MTHAIAKRSGTVAIIELAAKMCPTATKWGTVRHNLRRVLGNQIVRKFVDKDKVHAIVGLGFSSVMMASLKALTESGTVAIATNSGPSPLAGAMSAPNVFSLASQNDGAAESMGKFMQEKGHKKVYLMAPNYQAGKDMLAGFKRHFKGDIVDEVYTLVGQSDYSAEIAQLQAASPAPCSPSIRAAWASTTSAS